MTAATRDTPRDLRAYEHADRPKLKKDYADKLMRITRLDRKNRYYENPIPDGAVLKVRRRDVTPGYEKKLILDWHCPCCRTTHTEDIPETWLDEGRAYFVEESGLDLSVPAVIYLGAPYSHDDQTIRQERWLEVSRAAAFLMANTGSVVFSPLSMGHPIAVMGREWATPYDFAGWQKLSYTLLDAATHFVILQLEGWNLSEGLKCELHRARKLGLPVMSLTYNEAGEFHLEEPDRQALLELNQ